jgi:4-hydroxy-tetrahydrodipicolinate synthase
MTQKLDRQTAGVYIIAATPFAERGDIDFASLDRLIDFYIEKGVTGITILGMMGEADKLAAEERRAVIDRIFARTDARVPIVVGVSDAGLGNLAALSRYAMDKGAAGIMVAPTSGPAREDRVIGYFTQVCEAVGADVPVVFQDYPQATGVPVSAATIMTLTRELPQIVMLKHEDAPGLGKITTLRAAEAEGAPRLSILCGNGGLYLPQELARGADGAMTGFAYPEALVEIVRLAAAGKLDAAEDLYDLYLPILRYEQQPGFGLAARKMVLHRRGILASPATRAPGPKLTATDIAELDRLIARTENKLREV